VGGAESEVGDMKELTAAERKSIAALKKVAKNWPKTLWLFSGSGTLFVVKTGENGERVMTRNDGVDQDYIVDSINILNDGGDFD
jgi:hypothetical protein